MSALLSIPSKIASMIRYYLLLVSFLRVIFYFRIFMLAVVASYPSWCNPRLDQVQETENPEEIQRHSRNGYRVLFLQIKAIK